MKIVQPQVWANAPTVTKKLVHTTHLQGTPVFEEDEDYYRNIRNEGSNLRYGLLAAIAAFGLTMNEFGKSFFFKKKDSLDTTVYKTEYPANYPIEDRNDITELKNVDGFAATVFDGHGGWQCSEWARVSLHAFLDEELGKFETRTPTDEQVKQAMKNAFDRVENQFKRVALNAYKLNYSTICQTGSCCLCTVVINKKLYVANIGDCGGVLFEKQEDGEYKPIKMNTQQSAEVEEERERLRKKFPNDPDIVHQKRKGGAWYVKKRLMPTMAFGDLHLKHEEFNNPKNFPRHFGYKSQITPWTGPYISHEPEIRVYDVSNNHKGYLLASDGLWDEMNIEEVARKFTENDKVHPNTFIKRLMKDALMVAAGKAGLTYSNLLNVDQGRRRRSMHDDITILFVKLE